MPEQQPDTVTELAGKAAFAAFWPEGTAISWEESANDRRDTWRRVAQAVLDATAPTSTSTSTPQRERLVQRLAQIIHDHSCDCGSAWHLDEDQEAARAVLASGVVVPRADAVPRQELERISAVWAADEEEAEAREVTCVRDGKDCADELLTVLAGGAS